MGSDKKGMMDDMFDFLFTVMAAFFILFFIISLGGKAAEKGESALKDIEELNSNSVLLNYLRARVGEGRTMADLIVTSKLELTELEESTHEFFSEEDCLLVVLPPLVELPPEVLGSRRGSTPGEEKLEERKVFHCPDENKARIFGRLPYFKTGKVELIGPDLKRVNVFLEYSILT